MNNINWDLINLKNKCDTIVELNRQALRELSNHEVLIPILSKYIHSNYKRSEVIENMGGVNQFAEEEFPAMINKYILTLHLPDTSKKDPDISFNILINSNDINNRIITYKDSYYKIGEEMVEVYQIPDEILEIDITEDKDEIITLFQKYAIITILQMWFSEYDKKENQLNETEWELKLLNELLLKYSDEIASRYYITTSGKLDKII